MSQPQKTALVTGAGSGIGRGVAIELARMGFRLAIVGRDAAKLEGTKTLIVEQGIAPTDSVSVHSLDVADRPDVAELGKTIASTFGGLDVLVCNAGTNVRERTIDKLSPADWDLMINTNLTGAYNLVHTFLPAMRERKVGLIIQVASIAGLRASVLGGSGYSASKFGQAGFALTVANEVGKDGVRSSVIYPGEVNTPILDARPVPVGQERREIILQPEDVAAAVRFMVELHPRAHVPELVIKPTVDQWA